MKSFSYEDLTGYSYNVMFQNWHFVTLTINIKELWMKKQVLERLYALSPGAERCRSMSIVEAKFFTIVVSQLDTSKFPELNVIHYLLRHYTGVEIYI